MELRVLGPVEAACGGRPIEVGAAKERLLLVALGVAAGRVVSIDRLSDILWDGLPPDSAVSSLRVHVSRLRKVLSGAGCHDTLVTRPPGYVLQVDDVDSDRFADMLGKGRAELAAGNVWAASETLAAALALWRGPALADVAGAPFAIAEASRLEEARLGAIEDRVAADLACGRHASVVGELEALVGAHPLREGLWAHRLVALYRAGRQAEALRSYQDVRRLLADELGIDPSPALVRLEAAILAQDPSLDWTGQRDTDAHQAGVFREAQGPAPPTLPSGVVTFLLTDIADSGRLWDAAPAAMREALQRHETLIWAAVQAGGGTLIKSRGEGDASLSVFALASGAVNAAASLADSLAKETWPDGLALRVRTAVHTGEAFERDGDYYGPTLNRAARLRALAMGGQVVVSQATAEVVGDRLAPRTVLRDLGLHQLRGFTRGEQVYELVALSEASSLTEEVQLSAAEPVPVPVRFPRPPPPATLTIDESPFVGRSSVLERLRRCWNETLAGRRRAVLVGGEPGIGKTRLAAEFSADVGSQGAIVLYGRCDEDLGIPYQPVVEALRSYIAACDQPTLAALIGAGASELTRIVPEIAVRLGAVAQGPRREVEAERYLMFEAVVSALGTLAGEAPVLLVLDDLQWAAKPTLLLLRHLLRTADPSAVMVLASYRDTELTRSHPLTEMLADLRREPAVERVLLTGLDVDEITALVAQRAGREGVPDAATLHTETEGNPLFLAEMLRHFDERLSTSVPEGVRDVVARRLAQLSSEVNRVLLAASVIGPVFSVAILRQLDAESAQEHVLDALDEAVRARLIVELPGPPGQYSFAHALVRQTLYTELSATRRIRLHRRVGEALERLYPGDDGQISPLAHHFAEGASIGHAAQAADYGLLAAQQALGQLAFEEAAVLAERALDTLTVDDVPDRIRRFPLAIALAEARLAAGDIPGAKQATRLAAADARALGSAELLAESAALFTATTVVTTPDREVDAFCEEALVALGDHHPGLRARVLAGLAMSRSIDEAKWEPVGELAQEALDLARTSGDTETLVSALMVRAVCYTGTALFEEKLALADELVALGQASNDAYIEGQGRRVRGGTRLALGDLAGFEEDQKAIEDISARTGNWLFVALAAQWRGLQAMLAGRFEDARASANEIVTHAGRDPNYGLVSVAVVLLALWEQGRLDEVLPLLEVAVADSPQLPGFQAGLVFVQAELGNLEAARQRFELIAANDFVDLAHDTVFTITVAMLTEACAILEDAARASLLYDLLAPFADRLMIVGFGVTCLGSADRYLGMLAATMGRDAEAEAHFRRALDAEEALDAPPLMARTHLWWARFERRRGPSATSAEHFRTALGIATQFGMTGIALAAQ